MPKKFYDELLFLTNKIKEMKTCPTCGALYENGKCLFCKNKNIELETYLDDLKGLLKKININDELFFLLKSLSKDVKISFIQDYLDNYPKDFKEIYFDLKEKALKEIPLNEEETKQFELLSLSYQDYLDNDDLFYLIFKSTITKTQNFSYDFYKKIIIAFMEKEMAKYVSKPQCIIKNKIGKDKDEMKIVKGTTSGTIITLDESVIKDLYDGYIEGFFTIFHELTHIKQYQRQRITKFISYQDLVQIKESILNFYNDGFYDENYDVLSYENEARAEAIIRTIRFIKKLDLHIIEEESLREEIQDELQKNENEQRFFVNHVESLDNIFDDFIKGMPEELKKFPQLNVEYLIEDDKVRRKNPDELIRDFQQIDFSAADERSILGIKYLYRKLIHKDESRKR